MKKLMLSLVLLMSVIGGAMAQNDAMYIYRNDGEFNAFLKADVDSMVCSHYDVDSVFHAEWQMQVVYTADSIYKIPLQAIDSISFVTPETIVNPDVFEITAEHDTYLSNCDTLHFTLGLTTPSALVPSKGNIVVSTYDCLSFPDGIMARIISKSQDSSGIHFDCEKVGLDDVYDQLVFIGEGEIEDDQAEVKGVGKVTVTRTHNLWDKSWDKTLEKGGTTTDFNVSDAAKVVITVKKIKGQPIYFRMDLQNDLKSSITFNAKSSFGQYHEKQLAKISLGRIRIPQCPLLYIVPKLTLSAYFEEAGTVSLDFKAHYNRMDKVSFTYQNDTWNITNTATNDPGIDVASLSMSGYAEIGVIPDLLFSFCGTATGLGVEYTAGIRESIDFKFDAVAAYDEGMYSALKDSYAKTTMPQTIRVYAQVGLFGNGTQPLSLKKSFEPQVGSNKYLLPLFSAPVYTEGNTSGTAVLQSDISRDLLLPVRVGMAVYDDKTKADSQYMLNTYQKEGEWPLNGVEAVFSNLKGGKTYTAYPFVSIMGKELRATPSCEFRIVEPILPKITNFKQTGSHYSQGGYSNDGRTYDYKYEVATTVEIESLDGVSEWGYAYKDPYGNVKRIPLTEYGTSHTDTRYAYYRNESKATACLYGYVKYEGDDEYYDGEPHDYPLEYAVHSCPDSNHPHAIDLGLPSGTKWCCMNVGASSPEQPGGYYAWGETSEKSTYAWEDYQYYNSSTGGFNNIGSDIAGTSYDVAHVRMGGSWRMPSLAQQQELINNCTRTWTQQNGTNGILVTGKNGGQLFLPAAGYRYDSSLFDAGSIGYCWSSSLYPDDSSTAYDLYFFSGGWDWYNNYRGSGRSVRAVCP